MTKIDDQPPLSVSPVISSVVICATARGPKIRIDYFRQSWSIGMPMPWLTVNMAPMTNHRSNSGVWTVMPPPARCMEPVKDDCPLRPPERNRAASVPVLHR